MFDMMGVMTGIRTPKIFLIAFIIILALGGVVLAYIGLTERADEMIVNTYFDLQERATILSLWGIPPGDLFSCQTDLDCVEVRMSCCEFGTIISSKYEDQWDQRMDNKCPGECIDHFGGRPPGYPRCENNQCVGKFIDFSTYTVEECDAVLRERERNICYSEIAEQQKDFTLCQKISDASGLHFCLQKVMPLLTLTAENCNAMPDQVTKNACLTAVAASTGNYNLCLSTSDSFFNYGCFKGVIENNQNLSEALCDATTELEKEPFLLADRCWYKLGLRTEKSKYCTEVTDDVDRHLCIEKIVSQIKDPEECLAIDTDNQQADTSEEIDCVKQVGSITGNFKGCHAIPKDEVSYYHWFNCIRGIAEDTNRAEVCQQIAMRPKPANASHAFTVEGCTNFVEKAL